MTAPIETILTDIEGTTSSIRFVKDVLFPYAAQEIPRFVRQHRHDPVVEKTLADAAAQSGIAADDTDALIQQMLDWITADCKITALKTLQGLVWRQGYESGAYRAHIYPDAVAQLRAWHAEGLVLYVYSSGSIEAQQLFFRHSEAGDLTHLFNGYFDTTIGTKQSADSYRAIARYINPQPTRILFLSDVVAELDAARTAGLQTTLLVRGETDNSVNDRHPSAPDFLHIYPR
jgi:enolase-phosphatase E1